MGWILGLALALTTPAAGFSAWQHRQELRVPAPGLIKLNLPIDTLDAAQPGLEDVRVLDPGGNEVPYLVERVSCAERVTRQANGFKAVLETSATVLTLGTGFTPPVDAVTLETSAVNRLAEAPRYDLMALSTNLKGVAVSPLALSAIAPNPAFRPPEALPGIQDRGTTLDVSAWTYREPVRFTGQGVQQLELDLSVLSHASASFQDLRLMRDGEQLPYVIEHTSLSRVVEPVIQPARDPKRPEVSRWSLQLPEPSLPLQELRVVAQTPLFERQVELYEEVPDARGAPYRRSLGQAHWVRTPDRADGRFALTLSAPPLSDRLFLETDHGDNPAIDLDGFQVSYPVIRLLFKVNASADLFLYYGNREAAPPRYDLALVAEQFLAAERSIANVGPEERLKGSSWTEGPPLAGVKGILFWGVLALVVIALLVVISRLLPKGVD